jgi:hypothetical protein
MARLVLHLDRANPRSDKTLYALSDTNYVGCGDVARELRHSFYLLG